MNYTVRWILYLVNKFLSLAAIIWTIYSLVMLVLNLDQWTEWLGWASAGIVAFILTKVLYILRKNNFPLAGRDYL